VPQQPRSTLRSIDQWERSTGSVSPVLPRACVLTAAINIETLQCYGPNRFSIIIILFFEFTSSPLSLACVRRPRDSHNNNNNNNIQSNTRLAVCERESVLCVRARVRSVRYYYYYYSPSVRYFGVRFFFFFTCFVFRQSTVFQFGGPSSSYYFRSSCRSIEQYRLRHCFAVNNDHYGSPSISFSRFVAIVFEFVVVFRVSGGLWSSVACRRRTLKWSHDNSLHSQPTMSAANRTGQNNNNCDLEEEFVKTQSECTQINAPFNR